MSSHTERRGRFLPAEEPGSTPDEPMNASHAAPKLPRPLLAVVALVTACAVASCTGPSEESTEPEAAEIESGELHAEEEEVVGDEPESGLLGEEYQPTVDCLVEAGAAPEDYTVTQLESDLHDHFQDSDVDLAASEFDECLALSEIEFELEVEN
mgnify:CR=1 FL=1